MINPTYRICDHYFIAICKR